MKMSISTGPSPFLSAMAVEGKDADLKKHEAGTLKDTPSEGPKAAARQKVEEIWLSDEIQQRYKNGNQKGLKKLFKATLLQVIISHNDIEDLKGIINKYKVIIADKKTAKKLIIKKFEDEKKQWIGEKTSLQGVIRHLAKINLLQKKEIEELKVKFEKVVKEYEKIKKELQVTTEKTTKLESALAEVVSEVSKTKEQYIKLHSLFEVWGKERNEKAISEFNVQMQEMKIHHDQRLRGQNLLSLIGTLFSLYSPMIGMAPMMADRILRAPWEDKHVQFQELKNIDISIIKNNVYITRANKTHFFDKKDFSFGRLGVDDSSKEFFLRNRRVVVDLFEVMLSQKPGDILQRDLRQACQNFHHFEKSEGFKLPNNFKLQCIKSIWIELKGKEDEENFKEYNDVREILSLYWTKLDLIGPEKSLEWQELLNVYALFNDVNYLSCLGFDSLEKKEGRWEGQLGKSHKITYHLLPRIESIPEILV